MWLLVAYSLLYVSVSHVDPWILYYIPYALFQEGTVVAMGAATVVEATEVDIEVSQFKCEVRDYKRERHVIIVAQ